MTFRWLLTNALVIALVLAWLVPFACMCRYGTYTIREPSLALLINEVGLFIAILAFAVFNLVRGGRIKF